MNNARSIIIPQSIRESLCENCLTGLYGKGVNYIALGKTQPSAEATEDWQLKTLDIGLLSYQKIGKRSVSAAADMLAKRFLLGAGKINYFLIDYQGELGLFNINEARKHTPTKPVLSIANMTDSLQFEEIDPEVEEEIKRWRNAVANYVSGIENVVEGNSAEIFGLEGKKPLREYFVATDSICRFFCKDYDEIQGIIESSRKRGKALFPDQLILTSPL